MLGSFSRSPLQAHTRDPNGHSRVSPARGTPPSSHTGDPDVMFSKQHFIMSTQHDSEGFMSTPLEGAGARRKDNYYQDSEDNEVRFRKADEEYQRLKTDFARIARARRTSPHSRSDSSKSPSPLRRQPQRRSTSLP